MTAKRGSIVYGPYREWHITSVSVINILKRPTGVTITIVFSRRVSWWTGESEYSPHTIRLRGVYLSRRHQDRANSSPSPHYFTILASRSTLPRLASASSLAIFLERILPPPKTFSRLLPPHHLPFSVYSVQSPTTLRNTKISLSLFLYPLYIYLSIYPSSRFSIRSEIYESLSPNPGSPSVTRHELPPKNQKKSHVARGFLLLLRFFYDSTRSTNQSPQSRATTNFPSLFSSHSLEQVSFSLSHPFLPPPPPSLSFSLLTLSSSPFDV